MFGVLPFNLMSSLSVCFTSLVLCCATAVYMSCTHNTGSDCPPLAPLVLWKHILMYEGGCWQTHTWSLNMCCVNHQNWCPFCILALLSNVDKPVVFSVAPLLIDSVNKFESSRWEVMHFHTMFVFLIHCGWWHILFMTSAQSFGVSWVLFPWWLNFMILLLLQVLQWSRGQLFFWASPSPLPPATSTHSTLWWRWLEHGSL